MSTDLTAAIEAIDAHPDTYSLSIALAADACGHPVYWSTRSYHDAFATILADAANQSSLAQAISMIQAGHPTHPQATTENLLAKIQPMNARARAELSAMTLTTVAA